MQCVMTLRITDTKCVMTLRITDTKCVMTLRITDMESVKQAPYATFLFLQTLNM